MLQDGARPTELWADLSGLTKTNHRKNTNVMNIGFVYPSIRFSLILQTATCVLFAPWDEEDRNLIKQAVLQV